MKTDIFSWKIAHNFVLNQTFEKTKSDIRECDIISNCDKFLKDIPLGIELSTTEKACVSLHSSPFFWNNCNLANVSKFQIICAPPGLQRAKIAFSVACLSVLNDDVWVKLKQCASVTVHNSGCTIRRNSMARLLLVFCHKCAIGVWEEAVNSDKRIHADELELWVGKVQIHSVKRAMSEADKPVVWIVPFGNAQSVLRSSPDVCVASIIFDDCIPTEQNPYTESICLGTKFWLQHDKESIVTDSFKYNAFWDSVMIPNNNNSLKHDFVLNFSTPKFITDSIVIHANYPNIILEFIELVNNVCCEQEKFCSIGQQIEDIFIGDQLLYYDFWRSVMGNALNVHNETIPKGRLPPKATLLYNKLQDLHKDNTCGICMQPVVDNTYYFTKCCYFKVCKSCSSLLLHCPVRCACPIRFFLVNNQSSLPVCDAKLSDGCRIICHTNHDVSGIINMYKQLNKAKFVIYDHHTKISVPLLKLFTNIATYHKISEIVNNQSKWKKFECLWNDTDTPMVLILDKALPAYLPLKKLDVALFLTPNQKVMNLLLSYIAYSGIENNVKIICFQNVHGDLVPPNHQRGLNSSQSD